jgi:hypothetical protein
MKIEFDPAKNAKNIRERDLPFMLTDEFDWTTAMIVSSSRHGEDRFFAIGYIGNYPLWTSMNRFANMEEP